MGDSIHECNTYTAKIYVGFREGYSENIHDFGINICKKICQDYCNRIGLCVTIKPLEFIYTNGNEPGVEIGLIKYPRFLKSGDKIKTDAINLAKILKTEFNQKRVSVICSDKTYMIGELK